MPSNSKKDFFEPLEGAIAKFIASKGQPKRSENDIGKYYKVHLRADEANGTHTRFTVFMNGANCGSLCMREDEAVFFHNLCMFSTWPLQPVRNVNLATGEIEESGGDEVITSGRWIASRDEEQTEQTEQADKEGNNEQCNQSKS